MDILLALVDFILHIDRHLITLIENYGNWIYLILFAIIFIETGLVVMPFLPGDSLLFIVGTTAGLGLLNFPLVLVLLLVAAIAGDQCNYYIGRYFGARVFTWRDSRFFNRKAFDNAHDFYQKHGGITIFIARFMPFIRTFAPFVAGVVEMPRRRFMFYNISGALAWVIGITSLGYLFGQTSLVKNNLQYIIWALIILPGIIAIAANWLSSNKSKQTTS